MRKPIAAIAAALTIFTLAACGSTNTTSTNDAVAPGADTDTSSLAMSAMQQTWDNRSASDHANMCYLYRTQPNTAWDSFNAGAEGRFTHAQFVQFFDRVCGL